MARLSFRRPATATRSTPAASARDSRPGALAAGDDDSGFGPGWFESTLDLSRGLEVCEEASAAIWQQVFAWRPGLASAAMAGAA